MKLPALSAQKVAMVYFIERVRGGSHIRASYAGPSPWKKEDRAISSGQAAACPCLLQDTSRPVSSLPPLAMRYYSSPRSCKTWVRKGNGQYGGLVSEKVRIISVRPYICYTHRERRPDSHSFTEIVWQHPKLSWPTCSRPPEPFCPTLQP